MNRLWVRLTATFSIILLVTVILPPLVLFLLNSWGIIDFGQRNELTPEEVALYSERFERMIYRELAQVFIFTGFTGLLAGAFASRVITRPLSKLEEGTKAVGAQNLEYRVALENGSDEILAVADSFNQMASHLQQAEKQRQNLLADVAHELRTPLTVLQGNLRGILDDVFPLDKEEIGRLFDQTRHLTRLVNDLHELAQAEAQNLALNKSKVETPKFLQDIAAGFRPLAEEKEIELRVELLGKLPHLYVDRDRVQQSLSNLISNAIRYTPTGGKITLRSEMTADNHINIMVTDTGMGISPEQLPNVFDRFYRVDASRQRHQDKGGTGLGLAIVRAITESHGGTASASSAGENKGATFTISLPIIEEMV